MRKFNEKKVMRRELVESVEYSTGLKTATQDSEDSNTFEIKLSDFDFESLIKEMKANSRTFETTRNIAFKIDSNSANREAKLEQIAMELKRTSRKPRIIGTANLEAKLEAKNGTECHELKWDIEEIEQDIMPSR